MTDDDHETRVDTGFDGMLIILADHVQAMEDGPPMDIAPLNHLIYFIENMVENNPPKNIAHLIEFLCVVLGSEGMRHAVTHMREFEHAWKARTN